MFALRACWLLLGCLLACAPKQAALDDARPAERAQVAADPTQALHAAIEAGDLSGLESALAAGADLTAGDDDGLRAWQAAAQAEQPVQVRMLLRAWCASGNPPFELAEAKKALELAFDDSRWSDLMVSLAAGDQAAVQALLDDEADANARSRSGWTPLMEACAHPAGGALVSLLLAHGAARKSFDDRGRNALMVAARHGSLPAVELLLAEGVALDARRKKGPTALLEAARGGQGPVVRFLLSRGADWRVLEKGGADALLVAAQGGSIDAMEALVAAGADPQRRDEAGADALMYAARGGQLAALQHLLALGLDPARSDDRRRNLLLHGVSGGNEELLRFLLGQGALVDPPEGPNALRWAQTQGCWSSFSLLLQHAEHFDPAGDQAASLLVSAAKAGELAAVSALLDRGVEVDARGGGGATALYAAADEDHEALIRLLLARGADSSASARSGLTPLTVAARGAGWRSLALLLEGCEALPSTESANGNPLWFVIPSNFMRTGITKRERTDLARRLLELGADPNQLDGKGRSLLYAAICDKSVENARLLLAHGANPDAGDGAATSPLAKAAALGLEQAVRLLLRSGASVQGDRLESARDLLERASQDEGWTPLMAALALGDHARVEALLAYGSSMETKTQAGWTALLEACLQPGDANLATLLLERGADPNHASDSGITPLMFAARAGGLGTMELLVAQGADPDARARDGSSALWLATEAAQPEAIGMLGKLGADLELRHGKTRRSALHRAVRKERWEVAQALLEAGAQVDARDKNERTALMFVAESGDLQGLALLLAHSPDLELSAGGRTALYRALRSERLELASALLDAGANPASTDDDDEPLLHAIYRSSEPLEAVELLLDRGVPPDTPNPAGNTLLMRAALAGNLAHVEALLRRGADPELRNAKGCAALCAALRREKAAAVVERLLAAGADPNGSAGSNKHCGAAKGGEGYTIHLAAKYGDPAAVRALVRAGALVGKATAAGHTALMVSACNGKEQAAAQLLALGADPAVQDAEGLTALLHATDRRAWKIVERLAPVSAQLDRLSYRGYGGGRSALMAAARSGQIMATRALLDGGADPNASNDYGETALMMACQASKAAVAELLVARGACIDIRDNKGRTAIEHSRQAGLRAWLQAELEKVGR